MIKMSLILIFAISLTIAYIKNYLTKRGKPDFFNSACFSNKLKLILSILLLLSISSSVWAGELWELVPEENKHVPIGKIKIVEGMTNPEGVRFILKNLSVEQPIQITLVAKDDDVDLQLLVYKDEFDHPLLEGSTMGAGEVTFRFRSGDHVAFLVKGPDRTSYQLFAWTGPEMTIPAPPVFIPMSRFEEGGEQPTKPLSSPEETSTPEIPATTVKSNNTILYLLLSGILVLLVVIAVLLFRSQQKRTIKSIFWILTFFSAFLFSVKFVIATDEGESYTKPNTITYKDAWKRTSGTINNLRDELDKLPKTGIDQADDMINATKLMITFLEHFGFIDGREAAVRPNYFPEGMPPLPSRCYEDTESICGDCFINANKDLEKWRILLEKQFVIYKETELEVGRIIEIADAAAGLSPYAQFYWTMEKLEVIEEAGGAFYAEYDKNYNELMKRLNDSLISIGDCERTYFNDQDWYNRYGLPYYLFMRERYKRK